MRIMKKLFPLMTVMTIFMAILLVSTRTIYAASPMLSTPLIEGKKPPKPHTRPVLVIGDLSIEMTGNLNYANATPKATSGTTTTLTLSGTYQFKSKDNKPISKTVRLDVTRLTISISDITIPSDLTWTGKGTYNLNNGRVQIHCSATSGDTKYNLILHGRVTQPIVSLPDGGQGTVKFTSPQSKLVITQSDGSTITYFLRLTDGSNKITLTSRSVQ
jgi:hypothetical protein